METERLLELEVRDRGLAEREATTALGLYPVSVRQAPGVNGALVSFKFHVSAQSFIRVDACIDANSSVLLVLDGNVTAATHDLMIYRCLSIARLCVLKIYPGQLVSSPVPRVDGIITKRPFSKPPDRVSGAQNKRKHELSREAPMALLAARFCVRRAPALGTPCKKKWHINNPKPRP